MLLNLRLAQADLERELYCLSSYPYKTPSISIHEFSNGFTFIGQKISLLEGFDEGPVTFVNKRQPSFHSIGVR